MDLLQQPEPFPDKAGGNTAALRLAVERLAAGFADTAAQRHCSCPGKVPSCASRRPALSISKAERRVSVGYRPKGGDRSTPQVNIAGKWLAEMGFEVGMRLRVQVLDGYLLLIPEDRNVARYVQQKRDARQTRQQIETLLAQVSG